MPLADPHDEPVRKRPAYDDDEIDALVAYVGSLGNGPPLPADRRRRTPTSRPAASCSAPTARRATARRAPAARSATATPHRRCRRPSRCRSARRCGPVPGQMPVFGPDVFDDEQLSDIAAYVQYLRHPDDRGGVPDRPHRSRARRVRGVVLRHGRAARAGGVDRDARAAAPPTGPTRGDAPTRRAMTDDRETVAAGAEIAAAGRASPSARSRRSRLAVVYWRGGNTQAEGALLALVTGRHRRRHRRLGEAGDAARRGDRGAPERRVDRGGGRGVRRRLRGAARRASAAAACCSGSPAPRSRRSARRCCSRSARSARDRARG